MSNNFGNSSRSMDFGESIGTCLKKYAVFEGRASRSEFWPYFFVYMFGSLILDVSTEATQMPIIGIVTLIVSLGGMLPMISVGCRRMHDINKSGWWQLIPIYNLILWAQESSEGSTNTRSTQSSNFSEPTQNRSANNDLTDELEELEELYKDGTLSEAQFKKAKNKLLK
jgi:uncharacterized membrane protein YhaH (DUF805 family)